MTYVPVQVMVSDEGYYPRVLLADRTGVAGGLVILDSNGRIPAGVLDDMASVHGADIASATTIDLDAATGDLVDVTGTTTITAITLADGDERTVRFTGALTLTHGGSLVLPGGVNITTVAGDFAVFRGYASGVVRCVVYSPLTVTGTGAQVRAASPTFTGTPVFPAASIPGASIALGAKIAVLTETVLKSAFTDGGAAVGTFQLIGTVPLGALLLATKIVCGVAFSGDTSAVITVGDGSDVDRYHTGTPSIFAASVDGVECGIVSGTKLITTANRPTLTVTSNADFTNVNTLGSVTVSIYYIPTV